MASSSKKNKVKLKLLTGIKILLMVENGISGEIGHAIHRYAKTNNKCLKKYDKSKELVYLKYWNLNNLYEYAMSHVASK